MKFCLVLVVVAVIFAGFAMADTEDKYHPHDKQEDHEYDFDERAAGTKATTVGGVLLLMQIFIMLFNKAMN